VPKSVKKDERNENGCGSKPNKEQDSNELLPFSVGKTGMISQKMSPIIFVCLGV